MIDRCFVDTNIVLYALGEDKKKRGIARKILAAYPIASTQVVSESVNVCLRRFKFTRERTYGFAEILMRHVDVQAINCATIRKSAEIALRYQFSSWDSLIIASALLADCNILYSEDMQHRQVIDHRLVVVNPFI